MSQHDITLTVNGRRHRARVAARLTLVDFLRDELRLTGTHTGCEHGVCGACSILLDGHAVRSCLMFAVQADGAVITTSKGLRRSLARSASYRIVFGKRMRCSVAFAHRAC